LNPGAVADDEQTILQTGDLTMLRSAALATALFSLGSLAAVPSAEAQEKLNTWSGAVLYGPDLGLTKKGLEPPTTFSYVIARWTQPSVFCTTPYAKVSIWVGLDGDGTSTVEQSGTVAVCGTAATPLYYKAFWEMYVGPDSPGGEPFTVNPGDLIEASVTFVPYVGPGTYVLSVKDVTTGSSFTTAQECNPSVVCWRGTAEWIVERPGGGKYPLADFGTVAFSDIDWRNSGPWPTFNDIEMVEKSTKTILSTCEPSVSSYNCTWVAAGN
jgi:hypothetical protein